jgi:hypothetical protein
MKYRLDFEVVSPLLQLVPQIGRTELRIESNGKNFLLGWLETTDSTSKLEVNFQYESLHRKLKTLASLDNLRDRKHYRN